MWNLCVALFYEPDEVSWRARNIIHEFNKFPVISWWHVACHRRRDFLSPPLTPPFPLNQIMSTTKKAFFMLLGFMIWGHNRVTWFNLTCRLPCIIKSTFLLFFFRFSFCALQWLFRRCIILIVCICVLFSSLMSCVTIICWWQKKWCSRVSILVQCQYWQYWRNQYYTGRPNFVIVPLTLLCSVVCYAGGGCGERNDADWRIHPSSSSHWEASSDTPQRSLRAFCSSSLMTHPACFDNLHTFPLALLLLGAFVTGKNHPPTENTPQRRLRALSSLHMTHSGSFDTL